MEEYVRETSRAAVWLTRAVFAAACALSIYLAYATLQGGQVYGCYDPSCFTALRTRWGHFFGMPISIPGAIIFGALLILSFRVKPYTTEMASRTAQRWFVFLTSLATFVGLWLLAVQVGLMRSICSFCLVVDLCGLLIMILYISWFVQDYSRTFFALLVSGLVMAGHFIGFSEKVPAKAKKAKSEQVAPAASKPSETPIVQPSEFSIGQLEPRDESVATPVIEEERELVFNTLGLSDTNRYLVGENEPVILPPAPVLTPPQVFEESVPGDGTMGTRIERERFELALGKVKIELDDLPVIGRTNATHVVGLMYDYTYTNSVIMYRMMKEAVDYYNGQLAVVLIPVPLDKACNPWVVYTKDPQTNACDYVQMGTMIWMNRPEFLDAYEEYLVKKTPPPPVYQVERVVRKLIGDETFDHRYSQDAAFRRVRKNIAFYRKLDLGPLPKLITAKRVLLGVTPIKEDLYSYLENQLLLEPPGSGPSP